MSASYENPYRSPEIGANAQVPDGLPADAITVLQNYRSGLSQFGLCCLFLGGLLLMGGCILFAQATLVKNSHAVPAWLGPLACVVLIDGVVVIFLGILNCLKKSFAVWPSAIATHLSALPALGLVLAAFAMTQGIPMVRLPAILAIGGIFVTATLARDMVKEMRRLRSVGIPLNLLPKELIGKCTDHRRVTEVLQAKKRT